MADASSYTGASAPCKPKPLTQTENSYKPYIPQIWTSKFQPSEDRHFKSGPYKCPFSRHVTVNPNLHPKLLNPPLNSKPQTLNPKLLNSYKPQTPKP